jgi:FkbM family methyltransferase
MLPMLVLEIVNNTRNIIIKNYNTTDIKIIKDYTAYRIKSLVTTRKNNDCVKFGEYKIHYLNYLSFDGLMREIFNDFIYHCKLDKDSFIIDCGSNIGLSIIYFDMICKDCTILGFEPEPTTFKCLEQNINENSMKNVILINEALSNINGEIKFYVNSDINGSGGQNCFNPTVLNANNCITVKTSKLSSYITKEVKLLKLDIEGYEYEVTIDLATNDKLKYIKNIIMEIHFGIRADEQRKFEYILAILTENNFKYNLIDSGKNIILYARKE